LEKLRKFFTKRGVSSTTAILAGAISANSVQAAPVALAKTVSAVALAKGAAVSASTLILVKGALKLMAWTKMKTAIAAAIAVICAAGVSTGVYLYPLAKGPAVELQAALRIKKPATGVWAYPSEKVQRAILYFGTNRAEAFPILENAAKGYDSEVRKQAIAAMGMIDRPVPPQFYGRMGDPATNAVPFLQGVLFADTDLSSFALSSLHGLFAAKDIPALADLLVRSHSNPTLQKSFAVASPSQAQGLSDRANENRQLQRYVPEAIADTVRLNPEAAVPFVSSVEVLLDDANADVRFGAACALAEYKGADDAKISTELKAGLKTRGNNFRPLTVTENLEQLMAIEILQRIGPPAKSMIPTLLKYAKSIHDSLMRELAYRAIGHIDGNLRDTIPEVDQALKNDPNLKNTMPLQTNH
jgi:hypothetical protein